MRFRACMTIARMKNTVRANATIMTASYAGGWFVVGPPLDDLSQVHHIVSEFASCGTQLGWGIAVVDDLSMTEHESR